MKTFDTVKKNLETLGYTVSVFETGAQATAYLTENIVGQTVGIGGSMTVKEIGAFEALSPHNTVWWHWCVPDGMTGGEVIRKEREADIYISSVNGLSENGEIVNIDGNCNRVADIFYGHTKVYLLVGKNKLAATCEQAISRARNVAAPKNARRLQMDTPCVKGEERCYDCKSASRICKGLCVMLGKPSAGDFEILLINENLGY